MVPHISSIGLGSAVVVALALGTGDAIAQAPAHSFAELSALVKTGEQIYVTDDKGNLRTGRLVSLVGGQLELDAVQRPQSLVARLFFVPVGSPVKRYLLTEDSARRIQKDDSTLNGMLIGTAIGALFGVAACSGLSADEACPYSAVGFSLVGMALGEFVDDKIKTSLYISPHRAAISFAPLLTPTRLGLAGAIRF